MKIRIVVNRIGSGRGGEGGAGCGSTQCLAGPSAPAFCPSLSLSSLGQHSWLEVRRGTFVWGGVGGGERVLGPSLFLLLALCLFLSLLV